VSDSLCDTAYAGLAAAMAQLRASRALIGIVADEHSAEGSAHAEGLENVVEEITELEDRVEVCLQHARIAMSHAGRR
jgi:hypothetical protein